MDKIKLVEEWLKEEKIAHINGWDFSHIHSKYEEEKDLPWDYGKIVREYLKPEHYILDIDTGGGEFLLSLNHPYQKTSATEAFVPNVELCKKELLPLGIDFKAADGKDILPFENEKFDIIINRHGDYMPHEIMRVLKHGGIFITEQVGALNDRELIELLFSKEMEVPFPEKCLEIASEELVECGFEIIEKQEAFRPIKFWDIGALVWYAHIIEWEFPGFTVEKCLDGLLNAQKILESRGVVEGKIHRFLLVGKKN